MSEGARLYPPTLSRLEELRDEGDVPRGHGVVVAGVLIMLVLWSTLSLSSVYQVFMTEFRAIVDCSAACVEDLPVVFSRLRSATMSWMITLGAALISGAALGILLETGFYFRLFGPRQVYHRSQFVLRFIVSTIVLMVVALIYWGALLPPLLVNFGKVITGDGHLVHLSRSGEAAMLLVCGIATLAGIVVVVLDRVRYYTRNGMTRGEIEAEARENSVRPEFRHLQQQREGISVDE